MARSVLMAVGNTATSTSETTIAAGVRHTIYLDGGSSASLSVERKGTDPVWSIGFTLVGSVPALRQVEIDGPFTYRITRTAGTTAGCTLET